MLIMSGAISGEAHGSLLYEAINVLMYGVLGIVLLKFGYFVQDKWLLRRVALSEHVKNGNFAAGIVTAANLVSVAIIIKGSVKWIEDEGVPGLVPVVAVFIASQLILALVTALRIKIYSMRNDGGSWQQSIAHGNSALATRFAGQLLATAIAVTAAGNLINYSSALLYEMSLAWLAVSAGIMVVVWLIYKLMVPIILAKTDIVQEVDVEKNIGIAAIEASIFVGIASLITSFLG